MSTPLPRPSPTAGVRARRRTAGLVRAGKKVSAGQHSGGALGELRRIEAYSDESKAFLVKLRDPQDPYNTRLRGGLPPTAIGNASAPSPVDMLLRLESLPRDIAARPKPPAAHQRGGCALGALGVQSLASHPGPGS